MKLLANHEIRYIKANTYNAMDPKSIGEGRWKVTRHSVADMIVVEEVLAAGSTDYLFDKWTFSTAPPAH